jgi:iron complex transport system ATP-binding protein
MKLVVDDLAFAYPDGGPELKGIGFTLQAGETLCVLGPNGAGKTTLLRLLLGQLRPSAGSVTIGGAVASALPPRQLAQRVASVPQSSHSVFGHTVFDMVLMGRSARISMLETPGAADRRIAAEALARVGIAPLAGRPFATLSGGERQLCLIARAIAQEARILIMDEPAASLDFGNQAEVLTLIADLAAKGYAILMTTHHPDHAFLVGTKTLALRGGTVFGSGAPRDLLTGGFLSALYGADIRILRDSDGTAASVPRLATAASTPSPRLQEVRNA